MFAHIDCTAITIKREERQRKTIDTSDLEPSIKARGVLQPIIVTKDHVLVAGERRLTACLKLGLPQIPVRYLEDLPPLELKIIELEENAKRKDLTWQENVRAVAEIHSAYSDLALQIGGKPWTMTATAESLGVSLALITQYLRVFSELSSDRVRLAASASQAYNLLSRKDERKITEAMTDIAELGNDLFSVAEAKAEAKSTSVSPSPGLDITLGPIIPPQPAAPPPIPILHESFLSWAPSYEGRPFNFIHCDFPYGISYNKGSMAGRDNPYDDSPDVYWTLLQCFCDHRDRFMSPNAHLMFWFSMEYYSETLEFFRANAPELVFQKFPLVWMKSDNTGILPDSKRGPRRIYETAFIASREDRLIVKPVGNAYAAPTDKEWHTSTKTESMLRFFFQMFVDETTRLLDPTCGSGSALRAAESLGAKEVLGLELDDENCKNARTAFRSFRALRAAAKRTT